MVATLFLAHLLTFSQANAAKNHFGLANLPPNTDFTILVAGDSLVAGYPEGRKSGLDADSEGASPSAVGVLAREIAAHYPDIRVELILRSPEIDATGVSTCRVTPPQRRIIQSPPSATRTIRIVRDGIGGNNAARLIARWNPEQSKRFPTQEIPLEHWKADIVVIMLGVNDSLGNFSPLDCYSASLTGFHLTLGIRGESEQMFASLLRQLVARVNNTPTKPTLFLATAPAGSFWGTRTAQQYAASLRNVASQSNIFLIDVARHLDTGSAGCAHENYRGGDCIHPNATGYAAMGHFIFQALLATSY